MIFRFSASQTRARLLAMSSRKSSKTELDKVAVDILFRKHWSPKGWIKGEILPAEFDYAKQAGVMFDPIDLEHDAVIRRAIEIQKQIRVEDVGNAFLASLSSRRMDWRSALGSFAAIVHLPAHTFRHRKKWQTCAVCGEYPNSKSEDLNILSFERLKWGGVRHDQPSYAMLDLEWFTSRPAPKPTDEDLKIFRSVIDRISQLDFTARPRDIENCIMGLFPSNKNERRAFIAIFGMAGILIPRNLPAWGEYPFHSERKHPSNKNDWHYPVLWWTGEDGINLDAIKYWFSGLD